MSDASVISTMDFIETMTTPYGRTTFHNEITNPDGIHGDPQVLEATDPLGATERLESRGYNEGQPTSEELVPNAPELASMNQGLSDRNTYYWDKRAMALHPREYDKAVITHWHHGQLYDKDRQLGTKHSVKRPLEGRVWYGYSDRRPDGDGTWSGRPTVVARVLDDGSSQIYRYEYNAVGMTIRSADPVGRATVYVYGTNNTPDPVPATGVGMDLLQVKQMNPAAPSGYDLVASYTYNDKHQVLTATDASGQTITYTYTAHGQLHTVVAPPNGGLSEAERTSTYAYNGEGQLTSVAGPVPGTTTTYEYDGYGRVWRVSDPEGYVVTTEYDAMDRPTKLTYPDGTYEETTYDRLDASGQRDRLGRWTRKVYDALRRPIATRDAAGRTTQKSEWASANAGCSSACGVGGGRISKLIDANGNATIWEYDIQGRVKSETRANGAQYSYAYEKTTSRLKQVQDPNGNVKTHSYNSDNTLAGITYQPGPGVATTPELSFSYDPAYNRVVSVTDGIGTTLYGYHAVTVPPSLGAGKLKNVDGPLDNDTIEYGYDELGRATSRQIGSPANTQTQHFDVQGRLDLLTNALGSFVYTYVGTTERPESVTYPNGQQTTYAYLDNLGDHRLQEIHNKKPGGATLSKFNYTYDAVGNIMTWHQQTESNPAQVYEFGYDLVDQLTSAILKSTGPTPVTLRRYYYAYDPAGNRTAEQVDDSVHSWTYNNVNQLVAQQAGGALLFKGSVNEPASVTVGGKPATVTADGRFAGSAVVPSGGGEVVVTATDYASPARNTRTNTYAVTQSGAGKSFTYDSNGNLTSDGSKTYAWDAENRLVAVKEGANTLASFAYNRDGIRASKTAGGVTTSYVLDGNSVVEERSSAAGTTDHFQGSMLDSILATRDPEGVVSYYVSDHLGSIRQRTNVGGQPILTRDYDPWGNPLAGADASGWSFTGREWDAETGLGYYRARYYAPEMARFISQDPLLLLARNGPQMRRPLGNARANAYAYAGNTPIMLIDPLGLQGCYRPDRDTCCTIDEDCVLWCLAQQKSTLDQIDRDYKAGMATCLSVYLGCVATTTQFNPMCPIAFNGCVAQVVWSIFSRILKAQRDFEKCVRDNCWDCSS